MLGEPEGAFIDWDGFKRAVLGRPRMWVERPYIDNLWTLWYGYYLGSSHPTYPEFCMWMRLNRFPTDGNEHMPPHQMIRKAITGATDSPLSDTDDDRAVALLLELINEFEKQHLDA